MDQFHTAKQKLDHLNMMQSMESQRKDMNLIKPNLISRN